MLLLFNKSLENLRDGAEVSIKIKGLFLVSIICHKSAVKVLAASITWFQCYSRMNQKLLFI